MNQLWSVDLTRVTLTHRKPAISCSQVILSSPVSLWMNLESPGHWWGKALRIYKCQDAGRPQKWDSEPRSSRNIPTILQMTNFLVWFQAHFYRWNGLSGTLVTANLGCHLGISPRKSLRSCTDVLRDLLWWILLCALGAWTDAFTTPYPVWVLHKEGTPASIPLWSWPLNLAAELGQHVTAFQVGTLWQTPVLAQPFEFTVCPSTFFTG